MDLKSNPLYYGVNTLIGNASKICKKGVYIDAGANIGGMFPQAESLEIHAFEPCEVPWKEMLANWGHRPNTYFNQVGLSDVESEEKDVTVVNAWTLVQPDKNPGLPIVPGFEETRFTLKLIPLDTYVKQKKITVGVYKIDVDGYELKTLKGSKEVIARDRPFISIEFSYLGRYIDPLETSEHLVRYIVEDMGYEVADVGGHFCTGDVQKILECFPYHTSFDVILLPKESKTKWLNTVQ